MKHSFMVNIGKSEVYKKHADKSNQTFIGVFLPIRKLLLSYRQKNVKYVKLNKEID